MQVDARVAKLTAKGKTEGILTSEGMFELFRKFRNSYEIRLRELDERETSEETQKVRIRILQSYVNDLTAQNEELLKVAEDLESEANSHVSTLESKLQKVTSAVKTVGLQSRLFEMQDHDHHTLLKNEIGRRDESIQKLRQEVLLLQNNRDSAYHQLKKSEDRFHMLEKELSEIKQTKEEVMTELQVYKSKTSDLQTKLQNMKLEHSDALGQVQKLTTALQKLQTNSKVEQDALSSQLNEKMDYVEKLRHELEDVGGKYKEAKSLSECYCSTIKQLEDEIRLTATLSQESKQRGIIEGELILHYQENYQKATNEVESLKHELEDMSCKLNKNEFICHEELVSCDKEIKRLSLEQCLLQEKLTATQQEKSNLEVERNQLQVNVNAASEELLKKNVAIQQLETDLTNVKKELHVVEEELGHREIQFCALQKDFSKFQQQFQDAIEENGHLEARIKAFTATTESEHSLLQCELKNREEAMKKLKSQQLTLQETIKEQEEKLLQKNDVMQNLEGQLLESRKKFSEAQRDISELQEDLKHVTVDLLTSRAEQEHLQSSVSARDQTVLQLNTEVGKLQQFRQEKLTEIHHLSEMTKQLQQALSEKQMMLDAVEKKATDDYNILISYRDDLIRNLKQDLNESQIQHTEKYNEVISYEAQLSELQLENQAFVEQINKDAQCLVQTTEQNQQLEVELRIANEKHRTCQLEVGARDKIIHNLQEELDKLQLKCTGYDEELNIRDDEVTRINLHVKQLQNDLKDAQSQLQLSEDKLKIQLKTSDQLKSELILTRNAHSMEVYNFKQEIDDLKDKIERGHNDLTTAETLVVKQKVQLEELTKELAKEQRSCQDAIEEINRRGLEIKNQDQELKDFKHHMFVSKQELDIADKRMGHLQSEVDMYKKKCESAVTDVSKLESSLAKASDLLTVTQKQVMEKDDQLRQLKSELEAVLTQKIAAEKDLVNANSAVNRLENKLTERQNDFKKAADKLAKQDSKILSLKEQVAFLKNENFLREEVLHKLQLDFSSYKEKHCHDNSEFLEKENIINQLEFNAEQVHSELRLKFYQLTDMSENVNELKKELCNLKDNKKHLEDQISKLENINQEVIFDQASTHQMFKSEKEQLKEHVKQLNADLEEAKQLVNHLEQEVGKRDDQMKRLTADLGAINKEITLKNEEIDQLEACKREEKIKLADVLNNQHLAENRIAELEDEQLHLKEQREEAICQLRDATQEHAFLEEKMVCIEQSLMSVQEKLSVKVGEVAKFENDNRKLQMELRTVKEHNSNLEDEMIEQRLIAEKLRKDLLTEKEGTHQMIQELAFCKQKLTTFECAYEDEKESQKQLSEQVMHQTHALTQLQQEFNAKCQQHQELARQLQLSKKSVAELQDEIDVLQKRNCDSSNKQHFQEEMIGRLREENENNCQKIQQLKENITDRDGQQQVAKMNLETSHKQIQHQQQEIARYEESLVQLKSELEKSQCQHANTHSQLLECQQQVHDCRVQLSTLQGNHKETLCQLDEKSRQVIVLKTELNRSNLKTQSVEQEIAMYEDKMKRLKLEQTKLQERNRYCEDEQQKYGKKCQELQNELSVALDRNQHILNDLTAKDEELVLLRIKVVSQQEKQKNKTDENDYLQSEVNLLNQKVQCMAEEKYCLEKELAETKLKKEQLHKEGELVMQNVNQLVKEQKEANETLCHKIRDKSKAIMELAMEKEQLQEQLLIMQEDKSKLQVELDKRNVDYDKFKALQNHSAEQLMVIHHLRERLDAIERKNVINLGRND